MAAVLIVLMERSTFWQVRRAPISTIRISTDAMLLFFEGSTGMAVQLVLFNMAAVLMPAVLMDRRAYLWNIDFLTSTRRPHKYDPDKYERHDNRYFFFKLVKHGARTYPDRTYGGSPYLWKIDFLTSTTRPHKYDLDKYGCHDTREIFHTLLVQLCLRMAAVLIQIVLIGARRTYGKSHFLVSTRRTHKYDSGQVRAPCWKMYHGHPKFTPDV